MDTFNPFIITGEYISEEYFCDREFETKVLVDNILNGRNTVLISPRRMGKSGLIQHTFAQESIKSRFMTFSIDLYAASSMAEMVLFLGQAITDSLKSREKKIWDNFFSFVKSLRAGFTINPITGELSFDISLGEITRPKDSLEEIIRYLESSETPCVVAIDEFQQVAEFPEQNVPALLRTFVQKCKKTQFIFSGSKRRLMDKLFNSPSEPFYMSCSPLYLEPIAQNAYYDFSAAHFRKAGKDLDKDCFDYIYATLEGHTWYMQRVLNELYAVTPAGECATRESFLKVLDFLIKLNSRTFEEMFSVISNSQKQVLIAIAREGKAQSVTSIAFVRKHSLKSPSTTQSAIRCLYENETISKEQNAYFITNHFFAFWIREKYTDLPLAGTTPGL